MSLSLHGKSPFASTTRSGPGTRSLLLGMLLAAWLPLAADTANDTSTAAETALKLVHAGLPHDSLFGLAFQGRNGVAVGDHGLLLESRDGGATWSVDDSLRTEEALLGIAISGDRLLVVGQEGVIFTRRGTSAWESRESGTVERLLNVDLADDGLAVAVGAFGTLLKSVDYGQNWEPIVLDWSNYLDDPGYEPHLYDVAITADGRILLAGEFGLILESTDSGQSWVQRNSGDASIFGMTVLDNGRGLAVGQDASMLRTADGGESWSVVELPGEGNLLDVWLDSSGTAYAVGIRAMFRSADGGQSWTEVRSPDINRSWYTTLAANAPQSPEEGEGIVYMVGMLGMIRQAGSR